MAHFGDPFSLKASDRKLTRLEMIRGIRQMIAAEYEAVQMYQQLAESIDDDFAKEVLLDIAEEEVVHAGEFLRLLKHLDPKEFELYKEGYKEVEEMLEE